MKQIIFFTLLLSFFGCAPSSSPVVEDKDLPSLGECSIDGVTAPEWICGINSFPEHITAVGLSNKYEGMGRNNQNATLRAIEGLFSKLKQDIKMRSIEYFLRLGVSPDDYKNYPSLVSGYVSKKTLSKVDKLDQWIRPKTGVTYIIVGIKKKSVRKHSFDFLNHRNSKDEKIIRAFALSFDSYFVKTKNNEDPF